MTAPRDWIIGYDGRLHDAEPQYMVDDGIRYFGPFPSVEVASKWADSRVDSLRVVSGVTEVNLHIRSLHFPGKQETK